MASGKFRSESHLIDQKAVFFVRENLPTEWVVRELTPDYGLDLDVEVFEKENGRITTLGERLYLQVKGTTMANYIDVTYGTKDVMSTKRCVSFSLDTGLLHLVERVGNSLPILLVVVDLSSKNAYFSCLNDYSTTPSRSVSIDTWNAFANLRQSVKFGRASPRSILDTRF